MIKQERVYNLKVQKEETHKLSFKIFPSLKTDLPRIVDLRSLMPAIVDQGNLGSCTANALAAVLGHAKSSSCPYSRLYIYYNERCLENTVSSDSGATMLDGIKSIQNQGACTEASWPYDISKFALKPNNQCYIQGSGNKALKVKNINENLNDLKTALYKGYPIAFGILVFSSFESNSVAITGNVPIPKKGEKCLGGHAVTMVGYDDIKQCFIVRNSWGTSWGDKGHFYLPYNYILTPDLSSDYWIITKMQ